MEIDSADPPCFSSSPSRGGQEVRMGSDGDESIPGVNACLIPPLDEAGSRIMEIRRKLISLQELVDPGTILKMYEATPEDIELLAAVETELAKLRDADKPKEED
jgi:hypothetical protein